MRLLCVEDEAPLREDIAEFLRMKSYEVDEAATGEEAIEQIAHNHYDLVLCDIKMPKMDGYELLKQVRRENTLTTTPFIFLSALNERNDKMLAHGGGCDGYLTKPIDFSLLDITLRSYVERQRARDFLYNASIQTMREHVVSILEDTLNGPLSEASLISQHLHDTSPQLTPIHFAEQLGKLQDRVGTHFSQLHMLHLALQLQASSDKTILRPVLIESLICAAVEKCRYHYPHATVQYEPSSSPIPHPIRMNDGHLQRALAALMAALPEGMTTRDAIQTKVTDTHWILTISDHPAMPEEDQYVPVNELTNMATLAPVTRKRLMPLMYALQVAQLHGGQMQLNIWPGDLLSVRLILPQPDMNGKMM